jgi:hypothetical protein
VPHGNINAGVKCRRLLYQRDGQWQVRHNPPDTVLQPNLTLRYYIQVLQFRTLTTVYTTGYIICHVRGETFSVLSLPTFAPQS